MINRGSGGAIERTIYIRGYIQSHLEAMEARGILHQLLPSTSTPIYITELKRTSLVTSSLGRSPTNRRPTNRSNHESENRGPISPLDSRESGPYQKGTEETSMNLPGRVSLVKIHPTVMYLL